MFPCKTRGLTASLLALSCLVVVHRLPQRSNVIFFYLICFSEDSVILSNFWNEDWRNAMAKPAASFSTLFHALLTMLAFSSDNRKLNLSTVLLFQTVENPAFLPSLCTSDLSTYSYVLGLLQRDQSLVRQLLQVILPNKIRCCKLRLINDKAYSGAPDN